MDGERETAAPGVLCILAHQDDEIAMATRIAMEVQSGQAVYCAFLTDGGSARTKPAIRDAESRRVLASLGVRPEHVNFIGSRHGVPDQGLVAHLGQAFDLTWRYTASLEFQSIYCLAWEGGHMDHDAAHLVALAIARARGLTDNVRSFPIYHGEKTRGPLVRVMRPLSSSVVVQERRLRLQDGLKVVSQCVRYRSQRRTWLGLLPGLLFQLGLRRREVMLRAQPAAVLGRPHEGTLFYERRFGVSYEEWRRSANPFIEAHLA